MLDFPLHEGFFPQIALSAQELKYYKRLGKERVAQLIRVIEDAECAYKWTDVKAVAAAKRYGTSTGAAPQCQKAQFLDFQPTSKATYASTLLKASVQLADVKPDEILSAVAKCKTKDFRKVMKYVHGDAFVDGRTLFTFPSSNAQRVRPAYNYRAIKWHVMKQNKNAPNDPKKKTNSLDFAYLEYAGKRRAPPGSSVVGFCIQESIAREREIPSLENFGVARGYLSRTGVIISRTHQAHVWKVTSICQIDGDLNPVVRAALEDVMQDHVCRTVLRVKGLVDRQRVSSLRFVEQWQWVPNSDRKACAVCLRGFYFHRKHHCRTCGEVVCSSCAPLRELEEPIFDITQLRVCSGCMSSASANFNTNVSGTAGTSANQASTASNGDTESYIRGLRSPQHDSYENMMFQMRETRDRDRRGSDAAQLVLENNNVMTPPPLAKEKQQLDDSSSNGHAQNSPLGIKPQEKLDALSDVVSHIREIRDTINISISEVDYASGRGGEDDEYDDEADDHDDNDEVYDDVRAQMLKIRETLESSVHNFDAALANATHAPLYPHKRGHSDRRKQQQQSQHNGNGHTVGLTTKSSDESSGRSSSDDNVMTPEQFASVARITFAAARATKQAGEAFLSSCGSDVGHLSEYDDEDAASSVGGGRVRTPSEDSFATGYSDTSQDPYSSSNYERLMGSYDSEDEDDERDERPAPPPQPTLKRKKSINPHPSSTRRVSEIYQLEKKIAELQRSLEHAQRKLSVFDTDEPDPEQPKSGGGGALEVVYEESAQVEIESVFEVFGNRSDTSSAEGADGGYRNSIQVRPSLSNDELVTTHDLVTELRGVMNSSEVTKPTGRRSFTKPPSPPPPPPVVKPRAETRRRYDPYGYDEQRHSLPSFGSSKEPMPSPIPMRKSGPSPVGSSNSLGNEKSHNDAMDNTASSSASVPHVHSFTSSNGVLVGSNVVNADTSLESARYQHLMGSGQLGDGEDDDEDSSEENDDDTDDDNFVMMGTLEPPKLRLHSTEFGEPFFANRNLDSELREMRRASPGERRYTVGVRDESEDLKKLMEGLSRPRSNSMPFGSNQLGGTPTADDELQQPQYEKPAWSDNIPNRAQSAYHIEQTLCEVRSCLSSFLVECPSGYDRERKLSSIFKVLRSLHREGVRSKFRTLNHDDIRYTKVLRETPSIIRLLKLAGYVSLPQKLTMRRVDQAYIGIILREIQADLKH
uniref:FYVE-type domain-containing protein n=1 Tax=Globisporangium ultimum (strain ATCC 200006 / CBS 805.95 / DAOM BR144) TaxID=431595 RepID=K3W6G1_GLOUD